MKLVSIFPYRVIKIRRSSITAYFWLISYLFLIGTDVIAAQREEVHPFVVPVQKQTTEAEEEHHPGYEIEIITTLDAMADVSGGIKRQATALGNFDLAIEGDTEKMGWWPRGKFLLQMLGHYGGQPGDLVGDLQGVSNIAADNEIKLYQAWYEQQFFDERFSILAGLYDYNSEFYTLDTAGTFINSSFGIGPDVSQTSPSIYPDTATSIRLKYQITPTIYGLALVTDGYFLTDPELPRHHHLIPSLQDGLFMGMEVGMIHPQESSPAHSKLALGVWHNTADFNDFNDIPRKNVSGIYFIAEKTLFKGQNPSQGLAGFIQFGTTQGDRNQIANYLGTGLTYQGLFERRSDDILGLGLARATNSHQYLAANPGLLHSETTLELTYQANLSHNFMLQPDLQYVINPGTDPTLHNALVVYFRVQKIF